MVCKVNHYIAKVGIDLCSGWYPSEEMKNEVTQAPLRADLMRYCGVENRTSIKTPSDKTRDHF